jgi:hypothetical protein
MIIKKVDPILGRFKPNITSDELNKISHSLQELPYRFDESAVLDDKCRRVRLFCDCFQDQACIMDPVGLIAEYNRLEVKINVFESII